MNTDTTIFDILMSDKGRTIIVALDMEAPGEKQTIEVNLDAAKMGIDPKGEFEMELFKDFRREVEKYYNQHGHLPTVDYLKQEIEQCFYGMGKYESKFADTLLNMTYGVCGIPQMVDRLQSLIDNGFLKRECVKSLFTQRNLREFDRLAKVYKQKDAPSKLRSFIKTI